MQLIQDPSVDVFLQEASELLYEREAEYGLLLGLAENLLKRPLENYRPLFLRVVDQEGRTRAAFLQTREDNGIITEAGAEEAELLARYILREGRALGGVVGPVATAGAFAKTLVQARGGVITPFMRQKILKLTQLREPVPAEGQCVQARPEDLSRVTDFIAAFAAEALPHETRDREADLKMAELRIKAGQIFLWQVQGEFVASTAVGRPTRSGISVSLVYTWPERRGRGYASNLVAAVSQQMLAEGRKFCVLYTDASNPTSNKIYQELGYEIIADSAHLGV